MKKEGYTKPFTDASGSKGEKGRKGEKFTYCHKEFHLESACMQEKIDLMSQILQQNNLGDRIPEGAKKKKPEDLNSKKGNSSHALIAINSSPDAWIVDSGASHHMAASEVVYSSLYACKGPPILMGDNSSVEVTGKGRIELTNESFENVLHVPKLSFNLLSVYQMTNSGTENRVIFTPNSVDILLHINITRFDKCFKCRMLLTTVASVVITSVASVREAYCHDAYVVPIMT
jgi:hypothetical protein